jgi:hypothetical protein
MFLYNKLYYWLFGNMQYVFLHLLLCMTRVDERMLWRGCLLSLTGIHLFALYHRRISQAFSPQFSLSYFLYRGTEIFRDEPVTKSTGDKPDVSSVCEENKKTPIGYFVPRGTRICVWFTNRQSFSKRVVSPTLRTTQKYELLNTLGGEIRGILAVQKQEG